MSTNVILEKLILNLDLNFRDCDPKIDFRTNLGQKSQSSPFCLKIGTHGILEELILHPDLDFQNCNPKVHFWANLGQKRQSLVFLKISMHGILEELILNLDLDFGNCNPKIYFWGNSSVLPENWHTEYLEDADSYSIFG